MYENIKDFSELANFIAINLAQVNIKIIEISISAI